MFLSAISECVEMLTLDVVFKFWVFMHIGLQVLSGEAGDDLAHVPLTR